jgi:serralysin
VRAGWSNTGLRRDVRLIVCAAFITLSLPLTATSASVNVSSPSLSPESRRTVSGDFNGDGYSDVVALYDYGSSRTKVWFFRGNSTGMAGPVEVWDAGVGNWDWARTKLVAGDFNGDGLADVTAFYDYGSAQTKAWSFRGTVDGVDPPVVTWDSGVNNWHASRANPVAVNFNNDAYSDVIAFYDNGTVAEYGQTLTDVWPLPGSANGIDRVKTGLFGSGAWRSSYWDWWRTKLVAVDFDGGGGDVIAFYDYGSSHTRAWLFGGISDGVREPTVIWDSGLGNWDLSRTKLVSGDVNGDGYGDVIAFYDYGWSRTKAWLLQGGSSGVAGPVEIWDSGAGWDLGRTKLTAGDVNGDGFADVTAFYDYQTSHTIAWLFRGNSSGIEQPVGIWDSGPFNWDPARM